jgi:RNA polymerase primary sigma factor
MAGLENEPNGNGRARGGASRAERLARAWALVEAHRGFACWVAKAYRDLGVPEEDLQAEGYLGLLEAALRFDPGRGAKFSTYAAWWVRKRIQDAVAAHAALVRLPDYQRRRVASVRLAERELEASSGRKPTVAEIAARCRMDPRVVEGVLAGRRREVSLDDLVARKGDKRLEEVLPGFEAASPDAELLRGEIARLAARLLARLSARQRAVLSLRFGFEGSPPLPLSEVARRVGISRERVRQLERRALRQLRQLMEGTSPAVSQ